MNRVEDVAVLGAEDLDPLGDLGADFVGGAEGEGLLRVDAAAPEDDAVAEGVDEVLRVHAAGGGLDRVQDVVAGVDEAADERLAPAATVLEGLPLRVGVDPVVDLLGVRQVESR